MISSIEKPRCLFGPSTGDCCGLTAAGWQCCVGGGEGLWERSSRELSATWLVEDTSWQPSRCSRWCLLASLCVIKWVFKLDLWLKLLLQTGHLCGDSSMCRILWTAKVRDWQKPLPHSVHLNGFSFEWIYLKKNKIVISFCAQMLWEHKHFQCK